MSETPPHEPVSELARQLLASARQEEPPESSVQRAQVLVEEVASVSTLPAPRRRWLLWAVPAAAAFFGVVVVAVTRTASPIFTYRESEPRQPSSVAPDIEAPASASPVARSSEVAASPSASPSVSPSASSHAPEAVAQRGAPSPRAINPAPALRPASPQPSTAAPSPSPPRPATIPCDCSAGDLMCAMRCHPKKK